MKHFLLGILFFSVLSIDAQKEIGNSIINQRDLDALIKTELAKNNIDLSSSIALKNISEHTYKDFYIVRQRASINGVEIEGKDIVIAVKSNGGEFIMSNHSLEGLEVFEEKKAAIPMDRAVYIALNAFESDNCKANIIDKKLIYKESKGYIELAYKISLKSSTCVGHNIYYINAQSGAVIEAIIESYDETSKESIRNVTNQNDIMSSQSMACDNIANLLVPDPTGSAAVYTVDNFELPNSNFLGTYDISGPNVIPTSTAYYIANPTLLSDFQTTGVQCGGNYSFPNDPIKYRTTFAYVHLNKFLNHFNQFITTPVSPVKFNANKNAPTPTAIYSMDGIEYSIGAGYNPMAADMFHVAGGGADYYLTKLNNSINLIVKRGILDYMAQSYEWANSSQTDPFCFNFGGLPILLKRRTNAPICNAIGYSEGEYLSSLLIKLRQKYTPYKIDKLAILTADMLVSTDENNRKFAEKLFIVANTMMNAEFSCYDLVEMRKTINDFFNPCYPEMVLSTVVINDYWIKVNAGDTSKEPYWGGNGWESPDIFNTIDGVVQDPEFNKPNVMNVKITNIGTGNCIPQKIKLYWSANLTNQSWPDSWSNVLGEKDIPQIAPGESKIVSINWVAPNPTDYGVDELHFCVLARIVDQSDGIPRSLVDINKPEYTGPWSTDWNVRYFNGTAWRNMVVKKSDGLIVNNDEAIYNEGLLLFLAGPSNLGTNPVEPSLPANPSTIDFEINVLPQPNGETNVNPTWLDENLRDPLFFEKLDVLIKPLDGLNTILQNCDGPCLPPGTYELSQNGFYKILSHKFSFNKITLEPNKLYKILVKVEPKSFNNCSFSIIQRSDKNHIFGGETYVFLKDGAIITPRAYRMQVNNKINVSPNPVNSIVTISIDKTDSEIAKISLIDISGKLIKYVDPHSNLFTYEVDVSMLIKANYIVEVELKNGEKFSAQFNKE